MSSISWGLSEAEPVMKSAVVSAMFRVPQNSEMLKSRVLVRSSYDFHSYHVAEFWN